MRSSPPYRSSYGPSGSSFSFGPGPLSTALKALIGANVAMFFGQLFFPQLTDVLALRPAFVVKNLWVWELATYMFLHGGLFTSCSTCSRYGCSGPSSSACGARAIS